MILPPDVQFRVPSTSANLGPGFDVFGLALTRYSWFHLTFSEDSHYPIFNREGEVLPIPEKDNLTRYAYEYTLKRYKIEQYPGFSMKSHMELPTSRGFGSSACALTAGVAAASYYMEQTGHAPLTEDEELDLLNEMEGHPDNVTPARLGGFTLAFLNEEQRLVVIQKKVPESLGLALIVPRFQVSTKQSRSAMPMHYTLEDIKSNLKGVSMWMQYLEDGRSESIMEAIGSDRIHEPYRKQKIPGYDELSSRLKDAGFYGITVSGSGPGVVAYYNRSDKESLLPVLESVLHDIGKKHNQSYPYMESGVDYEGLVISPVNAEELASR